MKKFLLVVVLIAVAAFVVWRLIPNAKDPNQGLTRTHGGDAQNVTNVTAGANDQVFSLDADNTKINWKTTKTLAGKILAVGGGWSGKFGSTLQGEIIAGNDGLVKQIQANIDFGSMWTENDILTKVLTGNGFFEVAQHPTATFISTKITEGPAEGTTLEGATHTVEGNFELNGITKSISFPAALNITGNQVVLATEFSLNRQEFNVVLTNPPVGVLLGDKDISDNIALKVKLQADAAGSKTDKGPDVDPGSTEKQPDPGKVIDIASLKKSYTETVPVTQIEFDMILVPGDEAKGIKPFYIGTKEVTWDEFFPWVMQDDIEDEDEQAENRAMKHRPSLPYQDVTRGYGSDGFPALSMSKFSAGLYCAWLSEQTGKTYRMPTEQEWEYVYTQGGGNLEEALSADAAEAVAIYIDNSLDEILYEESTRQVGSKEPNSLGLYDMAGNVCEWVLNESDTNRVARGGHFMSELDELGRGRHVEDQFVWNRDYPNEPKSIWWFVNAKWVGIRLVCEP